MEKFKRLSTVVMYICFLLTVSVSAFFLLFEQSVEARDSAITRKGAGPLYWSTYEYQYVNDTPMPEDRWKANIDLLYFRVKTPTYRSGSLNSETK